MVSFKKRISRTLFLVGFPKSFHWCAPAVFCVFFPNTDITDRTEKYVRLPSRPRPCNCDRGRIVSDAHVGGNSVDLTIHEYSSFRISSLSR